MNHLDAKNEYYWARPGCALREVSTLGHGAFASLFPSLQTCTGSASFRASMRAIVSAWFSARPPELYTQSLHLASPASSMHGGVSKLSHMREARLLVHRVVLEGWRPCAEDHLT